MDPEHIVLCGGLTLPGQPRASAPLSLNLWGGAVGENVQLRIEDLHHTLYQNIPAEYQDLVEIATYVYCADQALARSRQDTDSFGSKWRRSIHLHIPVRRAGFWNQGEVKETLVRLLDFLSDDFYQFTFVPAQNPPQFQQYLDFGQATQSSAKVEQVAMFSGGLDSLAGAIEEVKTQRRSAAFVTHVSTSKNNTMLRLLRAELAKVAGASPPLHVSVRINKEKELGKEYTQRTRSFLFAALGCTVARMVGTTDLRFYENGVVSLNLPICAQVVGGRATRTTHPRVMAELSRLFSLVGSNEFKVVNPFVWLTKGEVIKRIVDAGCGPLIGQSVSCAHTWERSLEHSHCGGCSQCIDRRFGVIAAGAEQFDPVARYKTEIFTQSRDSDEDRILIAAYIERARNLGHLKTTAELIAAYPEVARAFKYLDGAATNVAQRVLDLHGRHAAEVDRVLQLEISRHASDIVNRKLPGDCLIRLVIDPRASSTVSAPAATLPENFIWRRGNVWEMSFRQGQAFLVQKHQKGCAYLHFLLQHPDESFPVSEIMSAVGVEACDAILDGQISAAEAKDGFAVSMGIPLGDGGAAIDQQALRNYRDRLSELRDQLEDAKEFGDTTKQQGIEDEILRITSHLSAGTAKGGRPRQLNDQRKRQRDAFRNSVTRTIEEIGKHDEPLAAHLHKHLKLGVASTYAPAPVAKWMGTAPRTAAPAVNLA